MKFYKSFDRIRVTIIMMVKAHGNCRLFCPAIFESFGYFLRLGREDDLFDITKISESELSQFPNLKTIDGTVLLMTDDVKLFLKSKGLRFLIKE
ncbi:hypothetical protein ACS6Y8_05890 [Streptococcus suis]|nr:hypothetical protein [Streptococcus suis]